MPGSFINYRCHSAISHSFCHGTRKYLQELARDKEGSGTKQWTKVKQPRRSNDSSRSYIRILIRGPFWTRPENREVRDGPHAWRVLPDPWLGILSRVPISVMPHAPRRIVDNSSVLSSFFLFSSFWSFTFSFVGEPSNRIERNEINDGHSEWIVGNISKRQSR